MAKATDHLGNEYRTQKEMCGHYGIGVSTYNARVKRGLSKEEALSDKKFARSGHRCTDHKGNRFRSEEEMGRHYGISASAYRYRIKNGWTLEEALTTPMHRNKPHRGGKSYTDPLGNIFPTKKAMAEYHGTNGDALAKHLRKGWTLEEALGLKKHISERKIPERYAVTGPDGKKYRSESEMCRLNGISEGCYRERKHSGKKGMDLLKKEKMYHYVSEKERTDHLGNTYNSMRDMCKAYGIDINTYCRRREKGLSVKDALTQKMRAHKSPAPKKDRTDHEGGVFPTVREMLDHWNIGQSTYANYRKRGFSAPDAIKKILEKKHRMGQN